MKFPRAIHAVILDMDGTLHDTEIVYHTSLKQAVAAHGATVTDAFCHSLIGLPGTETEVVLRTHLGPDFPFDVCNALYHSFCEAALTDSVPLKPGARELVTALHAHRYKLAIATSARRRSAESHLTRSGLLNHFPIIVTRDDVARGKPHPDLYLRAAERLSVAPEHCLAIEDSWAGIRAAHAAGMMPVMVPDLLHPSDEIRAMCEHVATDLHEVRALLASLAPEIP